MRVSLASAIMIWGSVLGTAPVMAEGDSFPLPSYDKGDAFTFNTDGTMHIETVLHGAADSYVWQVDNGDIKVTFADPSLPPQRIVNDKGREVERRVFSRNAQEIFPIHVGKKNEYEAEFFRVGMEIGETETHTCSVEKSFRVRVKAGAFQALEISCLRTSGSELIYYAPQVGHRVLSLKLDEEGKEISRSELIEYERAKPENMDYAKPTQMPVAKDEIVVSANGVVRAEDTEVIIPSQPSDDEDEYAQPYAKEGQRIKAPEKPDLRKKKIMETSVAIKQQEETIIAPETGPIPLKPGATILPPETPGGVAKNKVAKPYQPTSAYKSYGVQISSAKSIASARGFLATFWKRYGGTLEGLQPSFYEHQGKYRVIADSFDGKNQANALCRSLKGKGIDCWAYKLPPGATPQK